MPLAMEGRRLVKLDDVVLPGARAQAAELGLSCSICLGMLQMNPVETGCGHVFCSECLGSSATCPMCRSSLSEGGGKRLVAPASAAFQRLLAGVRVCCPNSPLEVPKKRKAAASTEACDWVGAYSDLLATHLVVCGFEAVSCPRACGTVGLRRKDLPQHLESSCPVGSCCEICGLHVPASGKELHHTTAALQHVELLRRRCDEMQAAATAAAASSGATLEWTLREGRAAAVQKGGWLSTRRRALDIPMHAVVMQVRFYPLGMDGQAASPEGCCAMEILFDELNCAVEIQVKLRSSSGVFGKTARLNLSRADLRNASWPNFCRLPEEDLRKPLQITIQLVGGPVLLRGSDSESSSDESW